MRKPAEIRAALAAAIPYLAQNPEALHVVIESGTVLASAAGSDSFEYEYTATLLIEEFSGDEDQVFVTLVRYLRAHQVEWLLNPQRMTDALTFEADVLNAGSVDLLIRIKLTERVIEGEDGALEHPEEPIFEEVWPPVPAGSSRREGDVS